MNALESSDEVIVNFIFKAIGDAPILKDKKYSLKVCKNDRTRFLEVHDILKNLLWPSRSSIATDRPESLRPYLVTPQLLSFYVNFYFLLVSLY